jgi:hypothetical protein
MDKDASLDESCPDCGGPMMEYDKDLPGFGVCCCYCCYERIIPLRGSRQRYQLAKKAIRAAAKASGNVRSTR